MGGATRFGLALFNKRDREVPEEFIESQWQYNCISEQLDRVQALIRQADAKAVGVLASAALIFNSVVSITFRGGVAHTSMATGFFFSCALALALVSAGCAIATTLPRLKNFSRAYSKFYFGDVSAEGRHGEAAFVDAVLGAGQRDWIAGLTEQLWVNSLIAARKHRLIRGGSICLLVSLVTLAAGLACQVL